MARRNEIGRNNVCPCGSGKKYKGCCLRRVEEARANDSALQAERDALLELEKRTADAIIDWVWDTEQLDILENPPVPWDDYNAGVICCSAAYDDWLQEYLADEGPYLDAQTRAWLEAQQRTWVGLWEATAVIPGLSILMVDRLSGQQRDVFERDISKVISVGICLVGRMTEWQGKVQMSGALPRGLSPIQADQLEQRIRRTLHEVFRLPKKRPLKPEELVREDVPYTILLTAGQYFDEFDRRPPLRMENTDGEELVIVEDRYEGTSGSAALEAIRLLGEVEQEDDSIQVFEWVRPDDLDDEGSRTTLLGRVSLEGNEVQASTNSIERADRLRKRLEAAGLSHRDRSIRGADELFRAMAEQASEAAPAVSEVPALEIQAAIQAMLDKHYKGWIDVAIPALGGQTPRKAVNTAAGRKQVAALLDDMEWGEQRKPAEQRYDFGWLRRELGV